MAYMLDEIGLQFAQARKMDEALAYHTQEEAIWQKLAAASSATPGDGDALANCQTNTAEVLRRAGRLDEALAACERALAIREPLVAAHPELPGFRAGLGETYLRLGQVRFATTNLAGAAAAWKRALTHYEGTETLNGESTFFRACCHAGMAGLAGRPASSVSAVEGVDEADKAMVLLRQAVTLGYRNPSAYRTESALDSLRNRPDFRVLVMDLAFPAEPFAE
jgi:tetratricopeptide (TPR) repeat protein